MPSLTPTPTAHRNNETLHASLLASCRAVERACREARLALRTATENLVEAQAALLFAPSTVEMGSARIAEDLDAMLRRVER